jgi:hypothetical protein
MLCSEAQLGNIDFCLHSGVAAGPTVKNTLDRFLNRFAYDHVSAAFHIEAPSW